ncbi:MAG: radical SAM protein [Muribaculaceae bacterium]|nr:radical SAM protein [Muribaculaceae bacterium]MDE7190260.1 radical SAM protein [Muribaculaceae bacterium]
MNTNEIWVLNPDYEFKSDLDRICIYSKRELQYDSNPDWVSYIHPYQAAILFSFQSGEVLQTVIENLSDYFNVPSTTFSELIEPYLGNKHAVYTEWSGNKIVFPKNVLIPARLLKSCIQDRKLPELSVSMDKVDLTDIRAHKAPHSILWMLTNKCLTDCAYCYADKYTDHVPLSTQQCLNIIDSAYKLGVRYIDIIGGEIFLRKDWVILLERMTELHLSPSFISTKMPVTDTIVQQLLRTGYKNVIQISLDSMEEEVLSILIKANHLYLKHLLKGIRLLDRTGFRLQVNTVLTKLTASEKNLRLLASFLSEIKNLEYWEIRVPEYSLYSSERFNKVKCSREQLIEIKEFVNNKLSIFFKGRIIFSHDALDEEYQCTGPEKNCFNGGSCGLLRDQIFILPDGKVSVCEQLYWHPEFIIGDLTENTIEQIWQSTKALNIFSMSKSQFRLGSKCSQCNFADKCISDKRRCVVKVMKAYGRDNWDYPDPRCVFAPNFTGSLKY